MPPPRRCRWDATTLCTGERVECVARRFLDSPALQPHGAWTDKLTPNDAECRRWTRYVDMPLPTHSREQLRTHAARGLSQPYIVGPGGHNPRGRFPGIALRTDAHRRLPGDRRLFQTLMDFIRDAKFERMGLFTYSQEEGHARRADGRASSRTSSSATPRRPWPRKLRWPPGGGGMAE